MDTVLFIFNKKRRATMVRRLYIIKISYYL